MSILDCFAQLKVKVTASKVKSIYCIDTRFIPYLEL